MDESRDTHAKILTENVYVCLRVMRLLGFKCMTIPDKMWRHFRYRYLRNTIYNRKHCFCQTKN